MITNLGSGLFERIKSVKIERHPTLQRLLIAVTSTVPLPPDWLEKLSVELVHDDGIYKIPCRIISLSSDEMPQRLHVVLDGRGVHDAKYFGNDDPLFPIKSVVLRRSRHSKTFPNASSLASFRARAIASQPAEVNGD